MVPPPITAASIYSDQQHQNRESHSKHYHFYRSCFQGRKSVSSRPLVAFRVTQESQHLTASAHLRVSNHSWSCEPQQPFCTVSNLVLEELSPPQLGPFLLQSLIPCRELCGHYHLGTGFLLCCLRLR